MKSFPINSLDFDEIKANFIEFLKQDLAYKDYNFEASGISSLINIFAYNAHYIGYYVKMLLNESFLDSAILRESLLSKAKLNGYIPKNVRSARARVILKCSVEISQDPPSRSVIIPRGSYFSGANMNNDGRTFYVIDDVICHEREEFFDSNNNHMVRYTSPEFTVYEGVMKKWRFVVDTTIFNQRFIIKDKTIDVDTLRVNVYDNINSTNRKEFSLANNLFAIHPTSEVFYISTNEEGYYEIFFGNNQFGVKPGHGSVIEASYLSSKGETGNGCKTMVYVQPTPTPNTNTTASFSHFITTVTEVSNGGMGEETIDELRFNIPHHYRRQNRIVTESDYRSILLSEFRDIDSMNVWGGEKNYRREYGTVFISIKPKHGLKLSGSAREEIERILSKYSVVGMKPKIIDPEYLYLDIKIFVKFNQSKTSKSVGEIERYVHDRAVTYSKENLDRFNAGLSEVDFLDYVRGDEPSITRIYCTKTMFKTLVFTYRTSTEHLVIFGNKIVPGSVKSTGFTYGQNKCILEDDGEGKLWVISNNKKLLNKPIGSVDYEKGVISLILDIDIISDTDFNGIQGMLKFTAKPVLPDIETYMNNIIMFNTVDVDVTYA
jgi:hypothetical protein